MGLPQALDQLNWAAKGLAGSWQVRRVTCVVPRAATGETKRPVTCTVVPGEAPAGCPEYANVPTPETWIGGNVNGPEHPARSVKLTIVRPVPEVRKFPWEKT